MTTEELIMELRARAEVEGAGSLGSLLKEAADRLEESKRIIENDCMSEILINRITEMRL